MQDLNETYPILAQLGYREMLDSLDSEPDLTRLGRVMRQDRQRYSVITENGIVRAALTTGQRFDPRDKTALPVVGDWVTLGELEAANATTPITGRIPRRSKLSRGQLPRTNFGVESGSDLRRVRARPEFQSKPNPTLSNDGLELWSSCNPASQQSGYC